LGNFNNVASDDFVPIRKVTSGSSFYVEVNFHSKNDNLNLLRNSSQNDKLKKRMMLFLYTSETMLPQHCMDFLLYDCKQFSCQENLGKNLSISFPYFNASGHEATALINLGNFWQLNAKALRSTYCYGGLLYYYGLGTYGSIGFGFKGSGRTNFRDRYPLFSIYLNQNGAQGELSSSKNLNKAQSSTPLAVLNSTENWHIFGVEDLQVGDIFIDLNRSITQIIFDINRDTLVFPSYIFRRLLRALEKGQNPIKCPQTPFTRLYRPQCSYHGELKDLPNITLFINGQKLSIPLSDYVDSPEDYDRNQGFMILNLSAGNNTAKIPETLLMKQYENSIILDQHIMRRYYTVFNGSDCTIEFYLAKHDQSEDDSHGIRVFAVILGVGGLILFLVGIGCCVKYICRRDHNKYDNSTILLQEEPQRQDPQDQKSHSGPSGSSINNRGEVFTESGRHDQVHQINTTS